MFDIASVTASSLNSGLWVSSYSTDYLHPNLIGYPAITSSGVINTALILRCPSGRTADFIGRKRENVQTFRILELSVTGA
jgi:hypothetical protein